MMKLLQNINVVIKCIMNNVIKGGLIGNVLISLL